MSSKDYELIAAALRAARLGNRPEHKAQYDECVKQVSLALRSMNPRFDRELFIAACERD